MRTLVVEDEKHLNRMISEAIQDEGYSVDSCFNGLEALELCACAAYDVIVLDIMMPKMDGFELVRRLRERGCKRRWCISPRATACPTRCAGLRRAETIIW